MQFLKLKLSEENGEFEKYSFIKWKSELLKYLEKQRFKHPPKKLVLLKKKCSCVRKPFDSEV